MLDKRQNGGVTLIELAVGGGLALIVIIGLILFGRHLWNQSVINGKIADIKSELTQFEHQSNADLKAGRFITLHNKIATIREHIDGAGLPPAHTADLRQDTETLQAHVLDVQSSLESDARALIDEAEQLRQSGQYVIGLKQLDSAGNLLRDIVEPTEIMRRLQSRAIDERFLNTCGQIDVVVGNELFAAGGQMLPAEQIAEVEAMLNETERQLKTSPYLRDRYMAQTKRLPAITWVLCVSRVADATRQKQWLLTLDHLNTASLFLNDHPDLVRTWPEARPQLEQMRTTVVAGAIQTYVNAINAVSQQGLLDDTIDACDQLLALLVEYADTADTLKDFDRSDAVAQVKTVRTRAIQRQNFERVRFGRQALDTFIAQHQRLSDEMAKST